MEFKDFGKREEKGRATFTIDNKLLEEFNKIVEKKGGKKSPIIEDLIRVYVEKMSPMWEN